MKKIWAPWRLEYILKSAEKVAKKAKTKATCVFCQARKGPPSSKNLVLHKGQHAYVIMNKFPYTNGHLMVIPNRHLSGYEVLTAAEHQEMGELMALSIAVLKKVFRAQGFNLGMNLGEVAGAGIAEHLHYHVVPRWAGDHNCMPVVSGVRVLIEYLEKTHKKLIKEFSLSS